MNQQMESKQQNKAEYQTPDIFFAEVDPVWCGDVSLSPAPKENETPIIFM